ncbi:MAG: hypothetical protein LUG16_02575, partial [Candidatus Gastranaerophilales bacterium]|nr:hypothetical protein [Candidatus Gastranaerophilales bacterium]
LYIFNRQSDYRTIFKLGGYTVSYLVNDFIKNRSNGFLNYNSSFDDWFKKYFIICEKTEKKKAKKYEDEENNENINEPKISFCLAVPKPENGELTKDQTDYLGNKNYLKNYEFTGSQKYIGFKSRCMAADTVSIYIFLKYLITNEFKNILKQDNNIDKIAKELDKNTYYIGKSNRKSINEERIMEFLQTNLSELSGFRKNDNKYNFDNRRFKSKRLWCVLRDYLYHPFLSECFKVVIGEKNYQILEKQKEKLELPGDVYNNNKEFAKCLWDDEYTKHTQKDSAKFNSSEFVRDIYNKEAFGASGCLPINLDITFLFVQNMCNKDKCKICPIENNLDDGFCHHSEGKYCPYVLNMTDLKYECRETDCVLKALKNSVSDPNAGK